MTDTLPEMWWPSPEAFEDLTVEDAEHGFDLSAPDDTECGEWLAFWNQDEAHHKILAKMKSSLTGGTLIQSKPKMSAQGRSRNTNLAATPNRARKKRYRGQGK